MSDAIDPTPKRKTSLAEIARAESDLVFWWAERHAALGIGATRIEPRTRATDIEADWQAIGKLANFRHRQAVHRVNRIAERLVRLPGSCLVVAEALYCPPACVYLTREGAGRERPWDPGKARGGVDENESQLGRFGWGVPLLARDYFAIRRGGAQDDGEESKTAVARRSSQGEVTVVGLAILILDATRDSRQSSGTEQITREFGKPAQARPRWCRELRDQALDARSELLGAYSETWP